ncbi:hypothetical protein CapIbe_013505 [Capra ibex]
MSFFGFGQSVDVDILLNDADSRRRAEHKTEDGKKDKYFLFYDGETVAGKVSLALKNPNKRLEHQGIKVEFIGQIELYYDRGNHHEFVSLVKDLARPGEVTQSQAFDFEFTHVEKPYESYTGQNVKLRYFLRATISRRLNDVVKEMDIVVHTLSTYPELNSSIKMEVGIEDCLHIEFEYNKSKWAVPSPHPGGRSRPEPHLLVSSLQVPPEGRHCGEDLLPAGADQDQAHGDRHHQAGDDGHGPQRVPRERHHRQVRDHGRRARERRVHPHPPLPGGLRAHAHHAGHQQEVLGALLPQPGAHRRRGAALLQAAGGGAVAEGRHCPEEHVAPGSHRLPAL